jgi:hypothetical protein
MPFGHPDIDTRLVVLTGDPESLVQWLSPAALDTARLVSTAADLNDAWRFVTIPLDGPIPALAIALRGLRKDAGAFASTTCVLVEHAPPPPPPVLLEVATAGMTPAVDLAGVTWATLHTLVISGPAGVVSLPYELQAAGHDRAIASLIDVCRLAPAQSPLATWTTAVASGTVATTPDLWTQALAAMYIESCVTALRRRTRTNRPTGDPAT